MKEMFHAPFLVLCEAGSGIRYVESINVPETDHETGRRRSVGSAKQFAVNEAVRKAHKSRRPITPLAVGFGADSMSVVEETPPVPRLYWTVSARTYQGEGL